MDRATAYAVDVIDGREVAGDLVRRACQRHIDDLETGPKRGLFWRWADEQGEGPHGTALHTVRFFEHVLKLDHDTQFILQPSQAFIIGSLFGWVDDTGARRFRVAYIEQGKGSGKSPLAAGIGLYLALADDEYRAEVYAAAVDRDQARILFRDAVAMVNLSPALSSRLHMSGGPGNEWNIAHLESGSFFRPLSSEHTGGRGKSGPRPHGVLLDELHEHPTSAMTEFMRAGTKNRKQALVVEITNSGFDRTTVCWHHHEYSDKVLRGQLENDAWFAFVCNLDACAEHEGEGYRQPKDECLACDDWRNEAVWKKANPTLGVTVTEKYLREQVTEAAGMPSKESIVKRLNFCIWTEAGTVWVSADSWAACPSRFSEDELEGRRCFGGLDLSSTEDLTAFVMVFPPEDEHEEWIWLCRFFVPADMIVQKVKDDRVPYNTWRDKGYIQETPGNQIDYEFIEAQVLEDAQRFNIVEIAYDRWNASGIVTSLSGEDVTMVPFGQGFMSMSAPMKEVGTFIKGRRLNHGGNPVLAWNVANVQPEYDAAENMKASKAKATGRIDGAVAGIMATGRAILDEGGDLAYNRRGLVTV